MRGAKTSPGESNLPLLAMERSLVVINTEVSAFLNDSTGTKKKKKKIPAVEKHRKEVAVQKRPSAPPAAQRVEAPQQWPGVRLLWLYEQAGGPKRLASVLLDYMV